MMPKNGKSGFSIQAAAFRPPSIPTPFGRLRRVILKTGGGARPLRGGERLVQKDLAVSLRLVAAEGAEAFYRGRIGRAIDDEMRRTGGFLALGDLSRDKAEWHAPVRIHYRGFAVYTASPPATAFPSLIRLGLMSRVDAKAMGHNSLKTLHFYA